MLGTPDLPPPPGLADLAAEGAQLALFLDFDGTLVEIAATPDGIDVPARLGSALCALAERFDGRVALVSGRSVADLESHLGALALACAGSHGADRRLADGSALEGEPETFPDAVRQQLRAFAAREGLDFEDKPHGAALHYRANPLREGEGLAFATALAERSGMAVKRGKCVVELVHPGADKGTALDAFMRHARFAGARPIFVGDDVTDEDGFAAAGEHGGFGVIVGERATTCARFRLSGPDAVRGWLGLQFERDQ